MCFVLEMITDSNNIYNTNNATSSHTGIYSIPYKDCNKQYVDETQRYLQKRNTKEKNQLC